eukprot:CAMPEP_0116117930 /NCGR_PEP_ID=MMETSP0329-20121206/1836_1 /TAXON_ID=697910 /ORGANISM="Pseudo-nitzschia arenysensis, Strain B593" /LENGTH=558 /DNA_ID=CAMNT_0003611529 /DNA_START=98 /DNA_END=1774 /DNA_ORIENTATION=+
MPDSHSASPASPESSSKSSPQATGVPSSATKFMKRVLSMIKVSLSMILILFSLVVISTAIITKQTVATGENNVHPILALCVFYFSLFWLAIMEGGLNCMVGLQPISKELYKKSHPKTYLCTRLSHKGQNIERFIVGRQYLDLMIVFITSFMVSSIDDASVLGLPKIVNDIFLGSDLAVILSTIVFGQLIAQINCAHSMLDFINNWVMVASTYVALIVEASGILHAVYFVQIIFTKIVGNSCKANGRLDKSSNHTLNTSVESGDSSSSSSESGGDSDDSIAMEFEGAGPDGTKKPLWQRIFFWVRVLFSLAISVFAIVVFSVALVNGDTTIREEIPIPVSFISLLILLVLGGFMEALQIALFAVKHLPKESIEANPRAKRNCDYILGKGNNEDNCRLQAFLVGRQIAQTVIMFMIARIITVEMKGEGETLFGVSPQIQAIFFDSGLLNALVSTIFASLSWRVTANFFPMLYLGSPFSIWIIRLCLIVEGTGVCDAAWMLAKIPAYIVGYKSDNEWITDLATDSSSVSSSSEEEDLEAASIGDRSTLGSSGDKTQTIEEC